MPARSTDPQVAARAGTDDWGPAGADDRHVRFRVLEVFVLIIITLVASLVIGLSVKSRGLAVVSLLAVQAIGFSYQSLSVLLAWMAGEGGFGGATETGAFGPAPTGFPVVYSESELYAYGLVNLVIILVGVGLTVGLHAWRTRRRAQAGVVTVS